MEIEVIPWAFTDKERVTCFLNNHYDLGGKEDHSLVYTTSLLEIFFKKDGKVTYAYVKGNLVGLFGVTKVPLSNSLEGSCLNFLCVHKSFRGQGITRKLKKVAELLCKEPICFTSSFLDSGTQKILYHYPVTPRGAAPYRSVKKSNSEIVASLNQFRKRFGTTELVTIPDLDFLQSQDAFYEYVFEDAYFCFLKIPTKSYNIGFLHWYYSGTLDVSNYIEQIATNCPFQVLTTIESDFKGWAPGTGKLWFHGIDRFTIV